MAPVPCSVADETVEGSGDGDGESVGGPGVRWAG